MKDVYWTRPYGDLGFELEWIKLHGDLKQTNVRLWGRLVRTFLSVEAAKRWCEMKEK